MVRPYGSRSMPASTSRNSCGRDQSGDQRIGESRGLLAGRVEVGVEDGHLHPHGVRSVDQPGDELGELAQAQSC
jgi:hypothetical protein